MGTRTVTGTVYKPDGTPAASVEVEHKLVEPFTTAGEYFEAITITSTTNASGQFSVALGVPDTGTAHWRETLPDKRYYEFYLAAGAPVDHVTLITVAGTNVAPDDLQTLIDNNNKFTPTEVSSFPYTVLATDDYIRCDGTGTVYLPPATGSDVMYTVKNVGTGVITIDGDGAETIDGIATKILYAKDRHGFIDATSGAWDLI